MDSALRPVNLSTDLVQLADLMELVFGDTMDANGHAAMREMRALGRLGGALRLLPALGDMTLGLNNGYVWIHDGQLVGNVSVYPANYPRDLGTGWIIANVGVHPDFRGRGIAYQLMDASMRLIRQRRGAFAILQVDAGNDPARRLYERLGFRYERGWTTWRRSSASRVPPPLDAHPPDIKRRRLSQWRLEYALAQRTRPAALGGLGWLRPLHERYFRPTPGQWIGDALSMRAFERLVIGDDRRLRAALWADASFGAYSTQLTLMVEEPFLTAYEDALLGLVLRRDATMPYTLEHPSDLPDEVLTYYGFRAQRTVMNMRWDAP